MRLSIFRKANPHPKGQAEKKQVGFDVSRPNMPEVAEFDDDEQLLELVTNYAWSPFTFSGHRHADNFISCDLLVYDVDDGLTIEAAQKIVKAANLACLCLPTPSHSEELHKFRLILPLARTIFSSDVYEETWTKGAALFGVVDEQCKDLARYFNGSTSDDGFWEAGELFEPTAAKAKAAPASKQAVKTLPVTDDIEELVRGIYGEERKVVPEAVDYFLRNAHTGMPGEWTNSLNRFCFSLVLSGVEECAIMEICERLAPSPLDKKDLYQIKKAIQDASEVELANEV